MCRVDSLFTGENCWSQANVRHKKMIPAALMGVALVCWLTNRTTLLVSSLKHC